MRQGIYMIMNLINNKLYIGSTKNFRKRKNEHFNSLRKNKHYSSHLQNAWNKYGEKNFIFMEVEQIEDENNLFNREASWIIFKKSTDCKFGYNLGLPCTDDSLNIREETRHKLLLATYEQYHKDNPNISLEEFLAGKRAKDLKIKKGIEHLKKKVFLFNKVTGEKELEFNSIAETADYFNKEHKSILRYIDSDKTFRGYILVREENYNSEKEYKLKVKIKPEKIIKERVPFKGNQVECINVETGEVKMYDNRKQAADDLNTIIGSIDKVIYGTRNHHRGYTFKLIKKSCSLEAGPLDS